MTGDRAEVSIGHWTDRDDQTGCTVVLFDRLVPAVADARGGAPGSRETDLLQPDKTVGSVDAILLTGGSAHGLAAADGVMRYLREHNRGVPTPAGNVPIVTAAVIFDLSAGNPVWPTAESGYAACRHLFPIKGAPTGQIGAGTGATFRKAWPGLPPKPGGISIASQDVEGLGAVHSCVVMNALGDTEERRSQLLPGPAMQAERTNTTLITVILDGPADARTMRRCAVAAHDALARVIKPAHTQWDGDMAFVCTTMAETANEPADSFRWTVATELAVERALVQAAAGEQTAESLNVTPSF